MLVIAGEKGTTGSNNSLLENTLIFGTRLFFGCNETTSVDLLLVSTGWLVAASINGIIVRI